MKKQNFKVQLVYVFSLVFLVNADFHSPDCKSGGWSCLNCKTRKYCMGSSLWDSKPCADNLKNNTLKYCNPKTNTCVADEPDECKTSTEFVCPSDGLFPNLEKCSGYFNCTDGVKKNELCNSNEYFRSDWKKCLPILSKTDCEVIRCSLTDSKNSLYDLSPLYYECNAGLLELKSCSDDTFFDKETKTCINICQKNANSVIEDLQNCSIYYTCNKDTLVLNNNLCPNKYGFNRVTRQCEKNLDQMCNEFSILDNDLNQILNKIPVFGQINNIVRSIFKLFKYNPLTLLLKFKIDNQVLTKLILTFNYIYENKKLPSGITNELIDGILKFLPKPIRDTIETILKYLPIGKSIISKRSIEDNSILRTRLEYLLENLQIDIINTIDILRNNNLTELKILIQNYLVKAYNLSEQQLSFIFNIIRVNLDSAITFVNKIIGYDLFELKHDSFFVNLNTFNRLIDSKMNEFFYNAQEFNYFFAELLKSVYRKYKNNIFESLQLFINVD